MYQFDQLSRWLQREGLGVGELTDEQAERFAAARRAAGLVTWASPRSAMLPVGYLRALGVAPPPVPVVRRDRLRSCSRIIAAICRSSVGCRITRCSMRMGRPRGCSWQGRESPDGLGLERLCAAQVSSFLASECPKRSVSGARDLVCALRSLLRYLHVAGLIEAPLVWAVPSVADLRDRTLPRGLEPAAVSRLLASCDRRRLVGRRDYAILLLLSRLGLRAGEVAAIALDDVDWRAGRAARSREGQPAGHVAVAGRCGRGDGVLSSPSPAVRVPGTVPAGDRAARGAGPVHGRVGRPRGVRPGGAAPGRRAPSAAHGRDRDAQGGRVSARDRPGAAPPRAEDDRDLRQGRPHRAAAARASVAMPGGAA